MLKNKIQSNFNGKLCKEAIGFDAIHLQTKVKKVPVPY